MDEQTIAAIYHGILVSDKQFIHTKAWLHYCCFMFYGKANLIKLSVYDCGYIALLHSQDWKEHINGPEIRTRGLKQEGCDFLCITRR